SETLLPRGLVFDIKRDCSEDGRGIRTTVFFKGCPLRCVWCQNPEGQTARPGIAFRRELCDPSLCKTDVAGPCAGVCPTSCLMLAGDYLTVRHQLCDRCDHCFQHCVNAAIRPVGYWLSLDELLYKVLIDRKFFESTGGGVTVSGGEPTMQMHFVGEFLKQLRRQGVDTAIETCGFFNYASFAKQVLPHLSRIYFDLKVMDEGEHLRLTGQSNRPILENLTRLAHVATIPLTVRVPLVPSITATAENLDAIARFLHDNGISDVTLLPYNPLWQDKPSQLGMSPTPLNCGFMSPQQLDSCVQRINESS
ncbi:MAG: glycyl-radical enzyme activating protein, partial [Gallionella sp.]|nr:glycyl-radical enzyme activating protein [Gallionella sp.]